jgi:hypothetical protein
MIVFYIIAAPGVLILLGCCFAFWLKKGHGFWTYFLLAWSIQILLSFPAGVWQSLFGWDIVTTSGTVLWKRLLLPIIGWPFNAAGFSVRFIFFDLLGKEIYGREGDILKYLLLMVLQMSIVASIFAVRYRRKKTFVDWFIICLGILFLVNSLVNVNWYWAVG